MQWVIVNAETLDTETPYFVRRSEIRQLFPLGMDSDPFDVYYRHLQQSFARIRNTGVFPKLRTRRVYTNPQGVKLYIGRRRSHDDQISLEMRIPMDGAEFTSERQRLGKMRSSEKSDRAHNRWRANHPEIKELVAWLLENATSLNDRPRFMTYGDLRKSVSLGLPRSASYQVYYERLKASAKWIRNDKGLPALRVEDRKNPLGVDLYVESRRRADSRG